MGKKTVHVICLNGPPSSGKDESGRIISDILNGTKTLQPIVMKFAEPLDDIGSAVLGIDKNSDGYKLLRETCKDQPLTGAELNKTMRDLLIGISEDLIKPMFGVDYFGNTAADKIIAALRLSEFSRKKPTSVEPVYIFTDSGFQAEFDAFKSKLLNSDLNVVFNIWVVKLYRDGYSFEGDSRQRVDAGVGRTYTVSNDGTLSDLNSELYRFLRQALICDDIT